MKQAVGVLIGRVLGTEDTRRGTVHAKLGEATH
jgi:hypothetical protein